MICQDLASDLLLHTYIIMHCRMISLQGRDRGQLCKPLPKVKAALVDRGSNPAMERFVKATADLSVPGFKAAKVPLATRNVRKPRHFLNTSVY